MSDVWCISRPLEFGVVKVLQFLYTCPEFKNFYNKTLYTCINEILQIAQANLILHASPLSQRKILIQAEYKLYSLKIIRSYMRSYDAINKRSLNLQETFKIFYLDSFHSPLTLTLTVSASCHSSLTFTYTWPSFQSLLTLILTTPAF